MAVNLLLSYAFHDRTNLFDIRNDLVCGRLMIDSGAFTAYTRGYVIKLDEYAAYLREFDGLWDTAVTLDVIGDPVASRKNTRKLHAMGMKVMPVFTRGESVKEFDAMIKDVGYVCVGGAGGMSHKHIVERFAHLQKRAADLGGGIHALGLGSIPGIRKVVPYSCDASNASGSFQYGTMTLFDGRRLQPVGTRDRESLKKHLPLLRSHGINPSWIIKNGKLPGVRSVDGSPTRGEIMHGIATGMAAADEYVNHTLHAPVPHTVTDEPGPHFYSAVPPATLTRATIQVDRMLHYGDWSPQIWSKYSRTHKCRAQGPGPVWDRLGDGTPTGPRPPEKPAPRPVSPKSAARKPRPAKS